MNAHSKRMIVFISNIAAATLACSAISTAAPVSTIAQDTPVVTEAPTQANILFEDTFDDPKSGFIALSDAEGITNYDQGGYRIKVDKANWFFWAESGRTFSDVKIEVDTTKLGGPDENEFGVICRYVDQNSFYFFTITSDGYYSMSKHINDDYEFIGMSELKQSSVIKKGQADNHLTAVCEGNTLRFSVNGTLLAEVQDDSFSSGDIGMIAGTGDTSGVDILFDNLQVVSP